MNADEWEGWLGARGMTAAEAAAELVEVNAAILRTLRAQSYTDGQQSVRRVDLDVLYARQRELQAIIDSSASDGSGGLAHNYVKLNRAS